MTSSVQEISAVWSEKTQTVPVFPQSFAGRSGYCTSTPVVALPIVTTEGASGSPLRGLAITQ